MGCASSSPNASTVVADKQVSQSDKQSFGKQHAVSIKVADKQVSEADTQLEQQEVFDAKHNRYVRRKLIKRQFLMEDVMKLTFELPGNTSLRSLGFDIGLGDTIRMRPCWSDHIKAVDHPFGGRAYSPVSSPDLEGQFELIMKKYGDGGVSALMSTCAIGSELFVTSHVEHVFWEERQRGYYCNERNFNGEVRLGLIAFGIGITEIAPVAMSELSDPNVKDITIVWANKTWQDSQWTRDVPSDCEKEASDLVRQLFAQHRQGSFSGRLKIVHLLSREDRPECLQGRVRPELLKTLFLNQNVPSDSWRFLSVGTVDMMASLHSMLADLGFDLHKPEDEGWQGRNFLYKKLGREHQPAHRDPSPLTWMTCNESV